MSRTTGQPFTTGEVTTMETRGVEATTMHKKRIGTLEQWIFEQGRILIYDDHHDPHGWVALAIPADAEPVTTNPPMGVGATKLDALAALCMVLGGEPVMPPW
jgi:hypothetical protein